MRSEKKHGPAARRVRRISCSGAHRGDWPTPAGDDALEPPRGVSGPAGEDPARVPPRGMGGGPINAASSRKYSATRPDLRPIEPAPTHTTSPLAHRLSIHDCE